MKREITNLLTRDAASLHCHHLDINVTIIGVDVTAIVVDVTTGTVTSVGF